MALLSAVLCCAIYWLTENMSLKTNTEISNSFYPAWASRSDRRQLYYDDP